jgi:hypothetical protein
MVEHLTHAQWCAHLFSRGSLAPDHKFCMGRERCVSKAAAEVITAMIREGTIERG